jgi:type IV pilus assembly protein PilW
MNIQQTYQRGVTLIELMIAITIGLLMLTVLAVLFQESTRSHKALSEASQQIENGRYAIQLLSDDLHLAGFYGRFSSLAAAPATSPDPCAVSTTTTLYDALPLHIQGFNAANFTSRPSLASAPLCAAILTNANLQPGSDIVVIRRTDTTQLTGTPILNDIYLQANPTAAEIQVGVATAVGTTLKANGYLASGASAADTAHTSLVNKDGTAAPIRKYHVHVYFVAPCSVPSNGSTTCTGSADDGGSPVPTLKRLELSSSGGATVMSIDSLVEGIEMMKVDYGVDTTGSLTSGRDGTPDGNYLRIPASLPADWADVMGVNVFLLSRNIRQSANTADTKTYNMGLAGGYTPGGSFKRHVYSTTVRLTNPSGRREAQ